ncbi:MAG: hypothetical protein MUE98_07070 [Rhodobacteraceae bacterium]|jgi:type II secretory pathway component GspD/PulD (secretin)|nr:hypothetical protein [Paracoccaceae bacterium]
MAIHRAVLAGLGALWLAAATAAAQGCGPQGCTPGYLSIPDEDVPYPLIARDIDIVEALKIFARNLRIGLVVTGDISGTVTATDDTMVSRRQYLDNRAAEFDFVWYFDGQVLRVSPIGEIETRIIPLQETSGPEAIRILQSLDIYQTKFTHRYDERSRTLLVAGPTAYVDLVEKAAEALEKARRTDITLLRGSESSTPTALAALREASGPPAGSAGGGEAAAASTGE